MKHLPNQRSHPTRLNRAYDQRPLKVGMPRALLYYRYGVMWTVFLEQLGAEVVLSPPTNRKILERGLALAVDESCLPLKIFLGHVDHLRDRADCVFIHRIESVAKEEWLCTKFLGLPDVCRNLMDDVSWLVLNMAPTREGVTMEKAYRQLGRRLGGRPRAITRAFRAARAAQQRFEALELRGIPSPLAMKQVFAGDPERPEPAPSPASLSTALRIAVLAHPYVTYDHFLGSPVVQALRELGVDVVTKESVPHDVADRLCRQVSDANYWRMNREQLGAGWHFSENGIDGLIFLMAFPCGPDALSVEMASRVLRPRVPVMTLVLDELQAQRGLQTRLESFIDILRMSGRRRHDHAA